jgi:N-acetylglutamate synthase-like GNAT family acetyltransferase
MSAPMKLRNATTTDLPRITLLLEENGLAVKGVAESLENFLVAVDPRGDLVGVAGFEHYGESCLLRSVAVDKPFRGQGYARVLTGTVLEKARAKGVSKAYLLTDSASAYFEGLGFQQIDRNDVDEPVKASIEFVELCSESAVAMRKLLE